MKIFKKVLNITVTALIVLVLVVSILFATLALTSKNSDVSSILGYSVQVIMSDSMKGGHPTYEGGDFEEGDVIIGKVTNNAEAEKPEVYKKGDIVTFKSDLQTAEGSIHDQLKCHRIVDTKTVNGEVVYQTQGDNKKISPYPDQTQEGEFLSARNIVTKYQTSDYSGFKIAGFGKVLMYLQTKEGFFFCVLLPMIIFFLYVLIRVVIDIVNYKNAKHDEERDKNADPKTSQMSDEEYEEFKAFMASKKADKENESATDSDDESDNEVSEIADTNETDEQE